MTPASATAPFNPMAARRPVTGGGTPLAPQLMAAQGTSGQLAQRPAPQAGSPAVARPRPQFPGGGNIGNSAPGSRSPTGSLPEYPAGFNAAEYPWMSDTSIQWGGGPHGYLPIGYQAQPFAYYASGGGGPSHLQSNGRWSPQSTPNQLAPWEYKYFQDTWTQNYDPNEPGYINTRGSRG